jgi:esterase/lipase
MLTLQTQSCSQINQVQEDVARYLKKIISPVLACFTDQDARVRYYACESMYNIAKVAKGEILLFFNDVFDALCKV